MRNCYSVKSTLTRRKQTQNVTMLGTLSAISQNRPQRVEISGFKTGPYLGVKTPLKGLVTVSPVPKVF
jgi:hypothetical protein